MCVVVGVVFVLVVWCSNCTEHVSLSKLMVLVAAAKQEPTLITSFSHLAIVRSIVRAGVRSKALLILAVLGSCCDGDDKNVEL